MFNISGTITLGGTAQYATFAKPSRKGYFIQNHSAGDLWINDMAVAVASQPSIRIPPGAMYETPSSGDLGGGAYGTEAISIIGATTGQAFTGRSW